MSAINGINVRLSTIGLIEMSKLLVELHNVSVDIPLRGVSCRDYQRDSSDPRILLYDNKTYIRALNNVSLKIYSGDRIGVVGGNGNGKTTLLKVIGGILPVTSGNISIYGSIRALLSNDAGCSMFLTGRKNIELCYELLQVKSMSLREYIDNVIDFAELGDFIDIPMGAYSPGMKSRLQFAMNTVEPASILLLDEWLGVSDRAFQEKAKVRMVEYLQKSEALLFASHSEDLINKFTNAKFEVKNGCVTKISGSVNE